MATTYGGTRHYLSNLNREPLLVTALIVVLAAFFATASVLVDKYREQQENLGRDWSQRGEKALQDSRYAEAVDDFRNALVYSRDNEQYRLRLAEALIAAGSPQQARAHLLNLLEAEPGDGEVSLDLARLAAQEGNLRDAQRYYQGAIYGAWRDDPISHRLNARFELAEFLIAAKQPQRAKAELVAIAAGTPENRPDLHIRLARLFQEAGDNHAALEQYKAAVAIEPNSEEALAGAGEAAFREQDYAAADDFLQRATRLNPNHTHSADLLKMSTLVLRMDPFRRGLNSSERARRAVELFQIALSRLQQCQASSPEVTPPNTATGSNDPLASTLARGKALEHQVRPQVLKSDPDLLENAVQWAFSAEQVALTRCGPASDEDQASMLIANLRQKEK
jgi:tetratricopeptide (TPR) repeat protein